MKTLKSIRLDNDLIEQIDVMAEKNGRSFSNQVERLLTKAMDESLRLPVAKPSKQVVAPVKRFTEPEVEEVQRYCAMKGYKFDAGSFVAHYESNGWKVGRNKMKSWKAACTTWAKRGDKANGKSKSAYQQRVEAGDARSFDIDTEGF